MLKFAETWNRSPNGHRTGKHRTGHMKSIEPSHEAFRADW